MKDYLQDDFIALCKHLAEIRQEKGLTQHQLATRCSVERSNISRIENGLMDIRLTTLLEMTKGLRVRITFENLPPEEA